MKQKRQFLAGAATMAALLAGCASAPVAQMERHDTLNERSDRAAHLDDRLPPNPNRPPDNREQKAVPTVVKQDPGLNKPAEKTDDKGLAVNAGPDKFVRPQDPTQTPEAPKAAGGPAGQARSQIVTSADASLSDRVTEALSKLGQSGLESNAAPALKSAASDTGEAKVLPGVEVTAKEGVVTLNGSVASEDQRALFEKGASQVLGVTSVNNFLTVQKNKQ